MAMSSYRFGFEDGVLIRGMPIGITHPGNVYWVDSGATSAGGRGDFRQPFLTLAAALTYAASNGTGNGDIIMVKPGHSETITGAGGITMSSSHAGMAVIGLGTGALRPNFLMDGGTSVTALISGANCSMQNLVFTGGHDGIVTCFDVTGVNFYAKNLEFADNTTAEHFLCCFTASGADNTADGLWVERCRFFSIDSGITNFISLIGSAKNVTVLDNYVCNDAATAAGLILCATGKILTGFECGRNKFICGNTSTDILIDNDATTNSGIVYDNYVGHHDTGAAIIIDVDGVRLFNNYTAEADTTSGAVKPAADAIT